MKLFGYFFALVLLFMPLFSQAGLVPVECEDPEQCGTCEFVSMTNNVIQFVLLELTPLIAVALFVYAGFLLVTSRGDAAQMQTAKKIFTNVALGLLIALAAYIIVNTVMQGLVGESDELSSWDSFECIYPTKAADIEFEYYNPEESDFYINAPTGRGFGGGSCEVLDSGPCSVSNLGCFGSDAAAMSQVCNMESGGNMNIKSGTDLCKDGATFSAGAFQINILANNELISGCSPDFFTKSGSGAQGDCIKYVTNSSGVRYCQYRDCRITDSAMYQTCLDGAMDPSTNISAACSLFSNGGFNHWVTSANRCGVI